MKGPDGGAAESVKRSVRKLVRRFGYEVVPTGSIEHHAFARHLSALFRDLRVDCVLDVGGNRGQYRDFLRELVGFDGWIISFEPAPRALSFLRERVKADSKWLVQGYALGNQDGRQPMNVMNPDFLSSFRTPDYSKVRLYTEREVFDRVESVDIRKLDSVFEDLRKRYAFERPYLKLDTQGFDLEVIRGAPATLPAVRALQTELSILPIYENAPRYREVLDELTSSGFEITGMFPVGRDSRLRVMEFDCVMINSADV